MTSVDPPSLQLAGAQATAAARDPLPWRMPAEWEPHERCLMAWPTREDLWGDHFEAAKREYAATANAIADFEPVTLVVNTGQRDDALRHVSGRVDVIEIPVDDSWVRDSGPIGVVAADGRRSAVDFAFNYILIDELNVDDESMSMTAKIKKHFEFLSQCCTKSNGFCLTAMCTV